MNRPSETPPRVAVVYHFFAHYRRAVMRELLRSERYHFVAVGDRIDPARTGIEAWDDCPADRFIDAPCRQIRGPVLLQRGLVRLALRRDLDAIIYLGNPFWPCTWLSALLARMTGKKTLFWTHGWVGRDHGVKGLVRRLFYRIPHAMLLYGHLAKMIGIDEGFDPSRLHVIYNSLDTDSQAAARDAISAGMVAKRREALFPGSTNPLVICTTRLIAKRRLDLILEAMTMLKSQGHPVDLLLVGDGPERANLEWLATEGGHSVKFFGACYEEAVLGELFMAANVTVSPGPIGLTAIHSLIYGTPVISNDDVYTQMPEFEAIVPGRTGDLFRTDDVEDLARCIRKWTPTREPDDGVRATCRELVERFFNPGFQRRAIERCLDGKPADDLFWMEDAANRD